MIQSRIAILLILISLGLFATGCGPEAATPDKLYGIWMGQEDGKQVTYTFILGGKCEIDYPKSGKPVEKATWEIIDGVATVSRISGTKQKFSLKGFELNCQGLLLKKLGMEYG